MSPNVTAGSLLCCVDDLCAILHPRLARFAKLLPSPCCGCVCRLLVSPCRLYPVYSNLGGFSQSRCASEYHLAFAFSAHKASRAFTLPPHCTTHSVHLVRGWNLSPAASVFFHNSTGLDAVNPRGRVSMSYVRVIGFLVCKTPQFMLSGMACLAHVCRVLPRYVRVEDRLGVCMDVVEVLRNVNIYVCTTT